MYRRTRTLHRLIGLVASLFLVIIAVTGFLLANKARLAWMRPPAQPGAPYETLAEVINIEQAVNAAFALGDPRLQKPSDIDRVDYRPKQNIFKIVSKEGYLEVQVDGKTGQVVSKAFRTDQLVEDIHDLSFFADWLHAYWLPVVAILLLGLALSGVGIYFVPVVRRYRFRKAQADRNTPPHSESKER